MKALLCGKIKYEISPIMPQQIFTAGVCWECRDERHLKDTDLTSQVTMASSCRESCEMKYQAED